MEAAAKRQRRRTLSAQGAPSWMRRAAARSTCSVAPQPLLKLHGSHTVIVSDDAARERGAGRKLGAGARQRGLTAVLHSELERTRCTRRD